MSDSIRKITLHVGLPDLDLCRPDLREHIEMGLVNLPTRFPGLKVASHVLERDRLIFVIDLGGLDEDIQRVVQTFKADLHRQARRLKMISGPLWCWGYDEEDMEPGGK